VENETLKQGDTVPGHVAILEGRDEAGVIHLHQAVGLDEPFLGWFYPQNLYPAWRFDVIARAEFAARYPGEVAR
jgi:hypothetical protein